MIIKGKPFIFMYETRSLITGAPVNDSSAAHTINIIYGDATENNVTPGDGTVTDSGKVYRLSETLYPQSYTVQDSHVVSDTAIAGSLYVLGGGSIFLYVVSTWYSNHDFLYITVQSQTADVFVQPQQFYPVDLSKFSSGGSGNYSLNSSDITSIAQKVWTYGDPESGHNRETFRTLAGGVSNPEITYSSVANAVWTYGDDTINSLTHTRSTHRKLTSNELVDGKETSDSLALSGDYTIQLTGEDLDIDASSIATEVWRHNGRSLDSLSVTVSGDSTPKTLATTTDLTSLQTYGDTHWTGSGSGNGSGGTVSVDTTSLATQVGRLEGYVDTLAANVGYLSTHTQTITTAATTLFVGTDSLATTVAAIPHDVWTYPTYADISGQSPVKAIADRVWGRNQNATNRQLTSANLGAVGAGALATVADITQPVIDSGDIQLTIPTALDVATAVWNYGKNTNAEPTEFRSLSTPLIVTKNGTTTVDVATVTTGSGTVDNVVWGASNKTLSSKTLDTGETLALSSDIQEAPDVSDLETITEILTKIFGVLCHWKMDGTNIVVYNDENETILTIPTVKNKYGDILQMGEIPEEA